MCLLDSMVDGVPSSVEPLLSFIMKNVGIWSGMQLEKALRWMAKLLSLRKDVHFDVAVAAAMVRRFNECLSSDSLIHHLRTLIQFSALPFRHDPDGSPAGLGPCH